MATPDMEQHSVPPGKSSDEDLNDFLCQTPTHSAINTLAADVCCPKIANHDIHRVNPFIHKLAWDDPIDKFKVSSTAIVFREQPIPSCSCFTKSRQVCTTEPGFQRLCVFTNWMTQAIEGDSYRLCGASDTVTDFFVFAFLYLTHPWLNRMNLLQT